MRPLKHGVHKRSWCPLSWHERRCRACSCRQGAGALAVSKAEQAERPDEWIGESDVHVRRRSTWREKGERRKEDESRTRSRRSTTGTYRKKDQRNRWTGEDSRDANRGEQFTGSPLPSSHGGGFPVSQRLHPVDEPYHAVNIPFVIEASEPCGVHRARRGKREESCEGEEQEDTERPANTHNTSATGGASGDAARRLSRDLKHAQPSRRRLDQGSARTLRSTKDIVKRRVEAGVVPDTKQLCWYRVSARPLSARMSGLTP